MTVGQTLATWSVMETIISVVGLDLRAAAEPSSSRCASQRSVARASTSAPPAPRWNAYAAGDGSTCGSRSIGLGRLSAARPPSPTWPSRIRRRSAMRRIRAIADCVGEASGRPASRWPAISFSAAMHSLVGVDAAGRPLTPLLTWADGRAEDQARRPADRSTRSRAAPAHRHAGAPDVAGGEAALVRRAASPDLFGAVRHWLGIKEFLLADLVDDDGDDPVVDAGIASGTGLVQPRGRASGTRRRSTTPASPPTGCPGRCRRRRSLRSRPTAARTPRAARRTAGGHRRGRRTAWRTSASAPSARGRSPARSARAGRSGSRSTAPGVDEQGRVFCYNLAPGRYVIGGAVNNGGIVLDWLRDAVAPDLAGRRIRAPCSTSPATAPVGKRRAALPAVPARRAGTALVQRAPGRLPRPDAASTSASTSPGRRWRGSACSWRSCSPRWGRRAPRSTRSGRPAASRAASCGAASSSTRSAARSATPRRPEGSSLGAALLGMTALGMLDSLDRAADLVPVASSSARAAGGRGLRPPAADLRAGLRRPGAGVRGAARPAD